MACRLNASHLRNAIHQFTCTIANASTIASLFNACVFSHSVAIIEILSSLPFEIKFISNLYVPECWETAFACSSAHRQWNALTQTINLWEYISNSLYWISVAKSNIVDVFSTFFSIKCLTVCSLRSRLTRSDWQVRSKRIQAFEHWIHDIHTIAMNSWKLMFKFRYDIVCNRDICFGSNKISL